MEGRSLLRLTIACALAATLALTLTSTAAASPGDQVTGGGISSFGTTFGFTAHDGPNGPSGHATFKNKSQAPPQADRKGHVICLTVDGNRAVFAVEEFNEATQTTGIKQFFVEDNGTGGSSSPKDQLTETIYDGCDDADDRTAFPITNGNIEVRDR
jgi:hypothetical protein